MEGENKDSEHRLNESESILQQTSDNYDRFKFYIEDLINFVFPTNLQHPLAAARLICFGLYGPLDRDGTLKSGIKGQHTLAEYELEVMCIQIEREDIVQIYLHKARDMGMLTTAEQDMMINQADAHLKREKGKAMLPRISKEDVRQILKNCPRDALGRLSFHDAQRIIDKYRYDRVKRYKLVFPNLTQSSSGEEEGEKDKQQQTGQHTKSATQALSAGTMRSTRNATGLGKTVSASVAPPTMFMKNKGFNNADLTEQTMKYMTKHGFKILDLANPSPESLTSNLPLLREVPPFIPNPYPKREGWDRVGAMKGVGLGSMVKGTGGSTVWKKKYTSY
eukprot:gene35852-43485_t